MARRLGKPLLPHQRYIFDVIGEINPDTGLLAYSQVVLIGPRQATGKSELLLTAMTYRCTGFDKALSDWSNQTFGHGVPEPGPQRALYAAQNTDESRLKWRDVYLTRLLGSRYRKDFTVRLRADREAMIWRNKSRLEPTSTTAKTGGTGRDTVDMGAIDEAWAQQDSRLELGLRPAMMTRDWRQLWVTSMIPGLARAAPGTWPYLAKKREVGRARVAADVRYGTAFFDYSAAPDSDPGDPATWWSALPGLGYTVQEPAILEAYEDMDLVDFCAEYLGWEPMGQTPKWKVIRKQTWQDLEDPGSRIVGERALAIEINDERTRAWIGVAGKRVDGHWHVEIIEPGHRIAAGVVGVEWVEQRAEELWRDWKPCTTVVAKGRQGASLIVPLRNRGIDVLAMGPEDMAGACGRFYDATGEGTEGATDDAPAPWVGLFHIGQKEIADALAIVDKFDHGAGAFTFVKRGRTGSLAPLYVVIEAMHGFEVKAGGTVEPDIFV